MTPRHAPLILLVGCCVLIPLPLVDGWVERRLTRALLRRVADDRNVQLGEQALHTLTEDRTAFLPGCLYAFAIWPVKKLLSTAFTLLLMKQGLDLSTRAIHRVHMLLQAIDQGLLTSEDRLAADAERVRTAMDATFAEVPTSPVGRLLRRKDNPPLPQTTGYAAAADPVSGLIRQVHHWGGAGVVAPKFAERIVAAAEPPQRDDQAG
ncbi:MAG: hypothetical protein EXR69_06210 [Myxococcales bacterium]|nr:hypothetical protein [Myxococcales bacterium]